MQEYMTRQVDDQREAEHWATVHQHSASSFPGNSHREQNTEVESCFGTASKEAPNRKWLISKWIALIFAVIFYI